MGLRVFLHQSCLNHLKLQVLFLQIRTHIKVTEQQTFVMSLDLTLYPQHLEFEQHSQE